MTGGSNPLAGPGAVLLNRLRQKRSGERASAVAPDIRSTPPCRVTPLQASLLSAERLHPAIGLANVTKSWRIDGPLNTPALSRAFQRLVQRHDALRMRVERSAGHEMPVFVDETWPELPVDQVPGSDDDEKLAAADNRIEDLSLERRGQDGQALWSARLFAISENLHVLAVGMSHVICDGWSWEILLRDLFALYLEETGHGPVDLPGAGSLRDYLSGRPPPAPLETAQDEARPLHFDWPGPLKASSDPRFALVTQTAEGRVAPDVFDALTDAARSQGCTVFHFLLAAYHLVLRALCDQDGSEIAVTLADRGSVRREQSIGPFLRMIRSRATPGQKMGFADFARLCRDELNATAGAAEPQMFAARAAIAYRNYPRSLPDCSVAGLTILPRPDPRRAHSTECNLSLESGDEGLIVRFEGQSRLFDSHLLQNMVQAYARVLEQVSERPEILLTELNWLNADQAGETAKRAAKPAPEGAYGDVCDKFARIARAHPDLAALTTPEATETYAELDRATNAIAAWLRETGLDEGHRLGVALPRGRPALLAWLAALKAGLTVVPINTDLPAARIGAMLDQAECRSVLAEAGFEPVPGWTGRILGLPEPDDIARFDAATMRRKSDDPNRDAAIMFTSGTTGRPKAIPISHAGILRLTANPPHLPVGPGDRMMQMASLGFDAALIEVFGAWLSGAELALCQKPLLAEGGPAAELAQLRPTAAFITTSLFNMIVDTRPEALASLRHLAIGGEALSADHAHRALQCNPGLALSNVYGPTENASLTTWFPVPRDIATDRPVPIGYPLPGNAAFVLSGSLKPLPAGFAGELMIGGPGLMRGYLGAGGQAEGPFVEIPGRDLGLPGGERIRLYKTGDRARWNADGALEYLGRKDGQIKFHGNRVEPAEIERVLMDHPGVGRAAVIPTRASPDGPVTGLAAFYEPRGEVPPSPAELRALLTSRLPRQIVPTRLTCMDRLPLTPNGKTDRQRLLRLIARNADIPAQSADAADDDLLGGLWKEELRITDFGETDDFFSLGGTSLSLIRLLGKAERACDAHIDLTAFLAEPTLARLRSLAAAGQSRPAADRRHLKVLRSGDPDLPAVVFLPGLNGTIGWAAGILDRFAVPNTVLSLGFDLPEPGRLPDDHLARLLDAFADELAGSRAARSFCLIGYSFAGPIITELALTLETRGVGSECLINVDGGCPLKTLNVEPLAPEDPLAGLKRQRALMPLRGHGRDIHLISSCRGFPFAAPNKARLWAETTSGSVLEYRVDSEHSLLVHPPVAGRLAALLQGILAGTEKEDARTGGTLTPSLLERVNRARRLSHQGRPPQAADEIEALLGSGQAVPGWVPLGLLGLYRSIGETGKARRLAKRLQMSDGSPELWQELSRPIYGDRVRMLRRCMQETGDRASGALPLTVALVRQGRTDEALAVAAKLKANAHTQVEAGLAEAVVSLGIDADPQAAHRTATKALSRSDAGPTHMLFAARTFLQQGQPDMALNLLDLGPARLLGPMQWRKDRLVEQALRSMQRPA